MLIGVPNTVEGQAEGAADQCPAPFTELIFIKGFVAVEHV